MHLCITTICVVFWWLFLDLEVTWENCATARGESSFRGKGSAPGCIPKLVLPRPD